MKTVLVTGCAGFIASHLCKDLINDGYFVIGIDNLEFGSMKNMRDFINDPCFQFYTNCVEYLSEISRYGLFPHRGPQKHISSVFHFAANSNIANQDPEIEYVNTFLTTKNMLDFCRYQGVEEFIFPSSGSIYGDAFSRENGGYVTEAYGPLLPESHYAAAKLASEAFICSYSKRYNIKSWILRFPNVVGGHATHGAILDFVKEIRNNPAKLEVLGDGTQTKPYLYVHELLSAIFFLWENGKENINLYNIAGQGQTSVKFIAESVIKMMGTETKIRYTGGDRGWPGDVPQFRSNAGKLNKLGWQAKLTSDEAVITAIKEIINETEN